MRRSTAASRRRGQLVHPGPNRKDRPKSAHRKRTGGGRARPAGWGPRLCFACHRGWGGPFAPGGGLTLGRKARRTRSRPRHRGGRPCCHRYSPARNGPARGRGPPRNHQVWVCPQGCSTVGNNRSKLNPTPNRWRHPRAAAQMLPRHHGLLWALGFGPGPSPASAPSKKRGGGGESTASAKLHHQHRCKINATRKRGPARVFPCPDIPGPPPVGPAAAGRAPPPSPTRPFFFPGGRFFFRPRDFSQPKNFSYGFGILARFKGYMPISEFAQTAPGPNGAY